MKTEHESEIENLLISIFNIGEPIWGEFVLDVYELVDLNTWRFNIDVSGLEWSMYIPFGSNLSDEQLRTMMERDYLRERDERE